MSLLGVPFGQSFWKHGHIKKAFFRLAGRKLFLHTAIGQENPSPLNGLLPDKPVSPSFKKRLCCQAGICIDAGQLQPLCFLFELADQVSGNSLALIIFMDVQPVQVTGWRHIAKAANFTIYFRYIAQFLL